MIGSILLRCCYYRFGYNKCSFFFESKVSFFSFYNFPYIQGAIVFSNIVTTVSPTYAQEVQTAEV